MFIRKKHILLNVLMLLALVTASISPACKFISGQSSDLIEICTSWGVKVIPAPSQGQSDTQKNTSHSAALDGCMFCSTAQTHKAQLVATFFIDFDPLTVVRHGFTNQGEPSLFYPMAYQSRAPPVFS